MSTTTTENPNVGKTTGLVMIRATASTADTAGYLSPKATFSFAVKNLVPDDAKGSTKIEAMAKKARADHLQGKTRRFPA